MRKEKFVKKILLLASILVFLSTQKVFAVDVYEVPAVAPTFEFNVYNQGETISDDSGSVTSVYTMSDNQLKALFDAALNWNFIINNEYPLDPNKLATFVVVTDKIFNASAGSNYVSVDGEEYLITQINAYINGKTPTNPSKPHGLITVGIGLIEDYPGWNYYTGSTALYQADKPDLYSTMAHEIYHAMGLITNAGQHIPNDKTIYFSSNTLAPISIWDKNLRIYKGSMTSPFDYTKILAADCGMSVRISKEGDETFDIVDYSPYFVGLNTLKVLTGKNGTEADLIAEIGHDYGNPETNLQAYIYLKGGLINYSQYYDVNKDWSSKIPKVLGLPVNVI